MRFRLGLGRDPSLFSEKYSERDTERTGNDNLPMEWMRKITQYEAENLITNHELAKDQPKFEKILPDRKRFVAMQIIYVFHVPPVNFSCICAATHLRTGA
jgi:hypothetical protein